MQSPEAPHTICEEIGSFLKVKVTEHQILEVFRALEAAGLVSVELRGPHPPPNDLWFIATRAGRDVVDREWDAVFPNSAADSDA